MLTSLKHFDHNGFVAGCDEAGRGCLAGPVFAAAVILPKSFENPLLNDSKKMSNKRRAELKLIIENEALAFAVAQVGEDEIDEINILNASIQAMHKALNKLKNAVDYILVDGNRFKPYQSIPHECVIKGDGKYLSIAAASVLAKESRDAYMKNLSLSHPEYGWDKNKGYPTLYHRNAIRSYGATEHHRRSFQLLPFPEQLALFRKADSV